jgi:hypothetical protein
MPNYDVRALGLTVTMLKPIPRADLERLIRRAREQQAEDDRLFVSRPGASEMLDLPYQSIRDLCENGELIAGVIKSADQARSYRIWVPSIYDFMVKRLIALGDPNDPPADARDVLLPQPPTPDDAEAQSAMRALIAARREAWQATETLIKEARQATETLADAQQMLVTVLPRLATKREKERAAHIALKELGITD